MHPYFRAFPVFQQSLSRFMAISPALHLSVDTPKQTGRVPGKAGNLSGKRFYGVFFFRQPGNSARSPFWNMNNTRRSDTMPIPRRMACSDTVQMFR